MGKWNILSTKPFVYSENILNEINLYSDGNFFLNYFHKISKIYCIYFRCGFYFQQNHI